MPINASHEFLSAEKKYLNAQTLEDRIYYLEEMIQKSPKHKGSENLLKELRTRLKKFKSKLGKLSKKKGGKKGVRKEGFQCALIGLPNSGKSSLLTKLTNASPKITPYQYTTAHPEIGTLNHEGIKAQIVDLPSIGSENFDRSVTNTADCIIIVLTSLQDLNKIFQSLERAVGKKIIVLNKSDLLSENEKRKLRSTIKSKKLNGVLVSSKSSLGLSELKQKIIETMEIIRVYTKEPKKPKTKNPIVLPRGSTVKDAAEEIRTGFSSQIKETRLTGPSSKFSNQRVGLNHKLKDLDIIEFHTK